MSGKVVVSNFGFISKISANRYEMLQRRPQVIYAKRLTYYLQLLI
jgi:hypothetical protein